MAPTTTTTVAPETAPISPTAPVTVEEISASRAAGAWARYVRNAPGGTVFHDPAWCAAVERTFGHRPLHRAALRCGRIVGVLPLMEVHSLLGGRMLVSVPYGNYGGILADDEEAAGALAREAERLLHCRTARVLDSRSAEPVVPDWETLDRYDAYVRELPATCDELQPFLPKRARAAARQARDYITVQHDPRCLRTVWYMYSRSMRRLGSINYPLRFFRELQTSFGDCAWVSIAYHHDQPVAGAFSLVWGDSITPYIQGIDERVDARGATNVLHLSIMERAVSCGLRRFDFGRSRKGNIGSSGFKRNQGFRPRTLGYQRCVPPGGRAPDLAPESVRYRAARQIWQRLPLRFTQTAGAWLARSIPG